LTCLLFGLKQAKHRQTFVPAARQWPVLARLTQRTLACGHPRQRRTSEYCVCCSKLHAVTCEYFTASGSVVCQVICFAIRHLSQQLRKWTENEMRVSLCHFLRQLITDVPDLLMVVAMCLPDHLSHLFRQAIDDVPDSLTRELDGNESMRRRFEVLCRNAQEQICNAIEVRSRLCVDAQRMRTRVTQQFRSPYTCSYCLVHK
jgi:hypothetical protein